MRDLVYVLINYNTFYYIKMFKLFLESLTLFTEMHKIDFLIICDETAHKSVKKIKALEKFHEVFYLIVKTDLDLKNALLRKFDIVKFPKFLEYSKILYIDIDILVQGNLLSVIKSVPAKHNRLYAAKEGDFEGDYWFLDAYKAGNIDKMRKENMHSFNSGMFLFKPSEEMRTHFKNVKTLALNFDKHAFYDQAFMNYYFSINRLVNTNYMNDIYIIFPDEKKYYPEKIVVHIAGIGRYKSKVGIMRKYLNMIIAKKKH